MSSEMQLTIVNFCKQLAGLLDMHHKSYDRETSDLMRSLAAYVNKRGPPIVTEPGNPA